MYDPKGNGKDRAVQDVHFVGAEPPAHLRGIMHRYLELNTQGTLAQDYRFHALPDACTYIVFDQIASAITGVSQLRAASEEFNLGCSFHFVNIHFLPGVWQSTQEQVQHGMVDAPYNGALLLVEVNAQRAGESFEQQQDVLTALVEQLLEAKMLAPNPVTTRIFQHLDEFVSVADMPQAAGLSARQLRQTLKRTTGFTPHDFLKVLRLQQSLNREDTWSYADQSHFIHSFRKATGYTPGKYSKKFDV